MTFYCEVASSFAAEFGMDDEGYLESIVGMFEADIKAIAGLEPAAQVSFSDRLDKVRSRCHGFGYGIGDAIDDLWARRKTRPR
jgi:hypothetical protein